MDSSRKLKVFKVKNTTYSMEDSVLFFFVFWMNNKNIGF